MQKTKKKYRRNTPKETQPKEIAACKRLFDAAIEVLKREGCPMNTKEIVKRAIELGLWTSTGAKTPEQTLYSAIFRENATKENPRIIKSAQKGKFEFGGSTIILLFQKGKLELNKNIISTSLIGREFPVKAGEKIGKAL